LKHISNVERRIFGAMTVILDESIGNITNVLKRRSLYESSLIIIASDNGAEARGGVGSNYPLRGTKGSLFEGSMRVHALVRSPRIPITMRGSEYNGLFHVTDW